MLEKLFCHDFVANVKIMDVDIEVLESYQTLRLAALHQTFAGELADSCLMTLVNGRPYEALDLSGLDQKVAAAAMKLFCSYANDPQEVRQLILENSALDMLERRIKESRVSRNSA